jgi:6-pyruvoyltetrahydropterin/6-carboxytetrahydropterin synthase
MVTMEVFKVFTFEAAHRLPNVPPGHRCAGLHGHTFSVEVRVRGPVGPDSGWVQDFADLKSAFQPLLDKLDHACLNEIQGLENPTSENIARWLWVRLQPALPGMCRITVQENCTCGCIYAGEDLP